MQSIVTRFALTRAIPALRLLPLRAMSLTTPNISDKQQKFVTSNISVSEKKNLQKKKI